MSENSEMIRAAITFWTRVVDEHEKGAKEAFDLAGPDVVAGTMLLMEVLLDTLPGGLNLLQSIRDSL